MRTCTASSRVIRRTSTFVSIDSMTPPRLLPEARFQLFERSRFRGARCEDRLMDVLGRVLDRPSHHNLVAVFVPLEHGARSDPQAPPHFGGDGDLALCCKPRTPDCHTN